MKALASLVYCDLQNIAPGVVDGTIEVTGGTLVYLRRGVPAWRPKLLVVQGPCVCGQSDMDCSL